jgi:hypothetical protein
MILTYIFCAILVLVLGWFAYLSYKDEFYPVTALMILSMAFIVSISAYDIFIKKEIKNHIEMKVVVPKNSGLEVNFVTENDDSISKHYVQYIDTNK